MHDEHSAGQARQLFVEFGYIAAGQEVIQTLLVPSSYTTSLQANEHVEFSEKK